MSNALQEAIAALRQQLATPVAELAAQQDLPSGYETGLRHTGTGSYTLMRDDGVTEVGAGPAAALLLDSQNGQATLRAPALALRGDDTHIHGQLWLGYQRFDPLGWYTGPQHLADPSLWSWGGPLVINAPALLTEPQLVVGPADLEQGQINVPFSYFCQPRPLFGPNEQFAIIARELAQLLHALTPGL